MTNPLEIDGLLAEVPGWQLWLRRVALPLSILLHALFAWFFLTGDIQARPKSQWIEMAVVEPPPPVEAPKEPPKPPKREAPKPPPPEEPVPFQETVKEAPPDVQPDARPTERVVRKIQGLSSSSFASGSGTGLSVRAGNTTRTRAGKDTLDIEAADIPFVPLTSVTVAPKGCSKPPVQVPKEAIDADVEGTLNMTLDVDAAGRIVGVHFQNRLGYGTEEACRAAALEMRCKPATRDGTPVAIKGMPHRCTIKAID